MHISVYKLFILPHFQSVYFCGNFMMFYYCSFITYLKACRIFSNLLFESEFGDLWFLFFVHILIHLLNIFKIILLVCWHFYLELHLNLRATYRKTHFYNVTLSMNAMSITVYLNLLVQLKIEF